MMDGAAFDVMTRSVAATRSRRAVLGAALGAIASAALGDRALAGRPRKPGEICRKDVDCATGVCGNKDVYGRRRCLCTGAHDCPGVGASCDLGVCHACHGGQEVCNGQCTSPQSYQTDKHNCGGCGNDCTLPATNNYPTDGHLGANAICVDGACVCPQGANCAVTAVCHGVSQTVSTAGLCCSYPYVSMCCSESAPGAQDGVATCCLPGVDCPFDDPAGSGKFACPNGGFGAHGDHGYVDNDICSYKDANGGATVSTWACLYPGESCTNSPYPCCLNEQYDPVAGVVNHCNGAGVCGPLGS